jgi:membrane protein
LTLPTTRSRIAGVRARVGAVGDRAHHTLIWQVWERMLETEFVDRSVALASKAFVSFFPLVIVIAAFAPSGIRTSILTTVATRLGLRGHALVLAKGAFSSAKDIRRATGILGLILTFFFASSFTTALQRVYARAWRRPPQGTVGGYTRGPMWLGAILGFMAVMGAVRSLFGDGAGLALFALFSLIATPALWTFTAWFMLEGKVRWRVLIPSGVITGVAILAYGASAAIWMPNMVMGNESQFGFFGVALALVSWFSGAALCIGIGACAGPVLAEDSGPVGRFIRGPHPDLLVPGAPPPLPGPTQTLRLRDAFLQTDDVDDDADLRGRP